jgi:APA family basic amino acid/polyamine antiporter
MKAQAAAPRPALEKSLGLLDATTIVMGSMIGSGVFIVAADTFRGRRNRPG